MEAHSGGRRCDAVVFDNDGLLLDTEQSWTRAEAALFERRGIVFTIEHKRDLLGSAPGVAAAKLERMLDEPGRGGALIMELGMLVIAELATYAQPRPGASELIATLREAGVPMALATNSPRMLLERALATGGIDPAIFAVVLTADDVATPKPAPEIYLAAAAALGTAPDRTLVLEDSPTGVTAGNAAGCVTFAVPSLEGVDLSAADLVLDSLASPEITRALGL